jgi:hypothetical protein
MEGCISNAPALHDSSDRFSQFVVTRNKEVQKRLLIGLIHTPVRLGLIDS